MRVEIKLSPQMEEEPYAVIYAREWDDSFKHMIAALEHNNNSIFSVKKEDRIFVLEKNDIFLIRTENEKVVLYTQTEKYESTKRLYQLEESLPQSFLRISKSALINMKMVDCVEPSFDGFLCVKLKNGSKEYISRRYVKAFKNYIGL